METNSRNENPKNHLEDLIFHEVLSKLPAKSLLRFKTVARHWNAFITSVEFLKTHVRHLPFLYSTSRSVLSLNAHYFMVFDYGETSIPPMKKHSSGCASYIDFLRSSCKCLSFLVSPWCVKTEGEGENVDDGDGIARKRFRRRWIGYYDLLLSSCNGIAFLVAPAEVDLECRFGFHYVLYNPVLGRDHFVKIPHPHRNRLGCKDPLTTNFSYGFGFGYVSSTEDYYIVAVNLPRCLKVVVSLYSVRSKKWKYDAFDLALNSEEGSSRLPLQFQKTWSCNTGKLIKETLHWGIKQGKENQFIFAYDLGTLTYSLLPYPNKFIETTTTQGSNVTGLGLCCLEDSLCAWVQVTTVVEIWKWKGLEWSGLFRIQSDHYRACDFFRISKTDHFMIFCCLFYPVINEETGGYYKLYLSDINGDRRRLIVSPPLWNVVDYVPSLESVLAMNSEPNDQYTILLMSIS